MRLIGPARRPASAKTNNESNGGASDRRSEPARALDRLTVPLAMTVRLCRRDDLHGLEWFGLFEAHRAWFEEAFRRQQRDETKLLVAEANGFPVGQVLVDFTSRAPESVGVLSALRVLPCFQNLGIGSRLLGAAERVLRERRLAVSEIGACTHNVGARRLYERLGYRVVAEQQEPYAYPRPDGSVDRGTFSEWIFRKPLR